MYVHAKDLDGETPVAVSDGRERYDLAIDFSWPAEDIVAGLQEVFRDGVDSGRWSRTDTHERSAGDESNEAAPHPESDLG